MSKRASFVLGSTGTAFSKAAGNVFRKDVLVEGEYQHPVQPWDTPLLVTKEYIERICSATNEAIKSGQRVYVPDGHSAKAKDNTGFATQFEPRFEDGKWRATASLTIEDPTYVAKVGSTIRDVSPLIVPYGLGDGKSFGERIAHVALVPDPVMPGQGDFVACSVESGTVETVEVPVLKSVPTEPAAMKIKVTDTNIKALALSGETVKVGDEVEIAVLEKALGVSLGRVETAEKAAKDAADALAAERAKPAPTVVKMLSVDAKSTPYFAEAVTANQKALATTLDGAQARGKIDAKVRKSLEKILSVRHAFALSIEGAATTVDVVAEAEAILAAIPDNAMVPVGEAAIKAGAAGASGRPANEPPAFDAKAAANEMLTKAGFKQPEAAPATK